MRWGISRDLLKRIYQFLERIQPIVNILEFFLIGLIGLIITLNQYEIINLEHSPLIFVHNNKNLDVNAGVYSDVIQIFNERYELYNPQYEVFCEIQIKFSSKLINRFIKHYYHQGFPSGNQKGLLRSIVSSANLDKIDRISSELKKQYSKFVNLKFKKYLYLKYYDFYQDHHENLYEVNFQDGGNLLSDSDSNELLNKYRIANEKNEVIDYDLLGIKSLLAGSNLENQTHKYPK